MRERGPGETRPKPASRAALAAILRRLGEGEEWPSCSALAMALGWDWDSMSRAHEELLALGLIRLERAASQGRAAEYSPVLENIGRWLKGDLMVSSYGDEPAGISAGEPAGFSAGCGPKLADFSAAFSRARVTAEAVGQRDQGDPALEGEKRAQVLEAKQQEMITLLNRWRIPMSSPGLWPQVLLWVERGFGSHEFRYAASEAVAASAVAAISVRRVVARRRVLRGAAVVMAVSRTRGMDAMTAPSAPPPTTA